MNSPVERATTLLQQGRTSDALALCQDAAARGDAAAAMQLANWYLVGRPVARDLAEARRWLRQATENGHADAALTEVALTANGSGGPADWPLARTRLQQAAERHGGVAAEDWALLDQMDLTPDGAPAHLPPPEVLGRDYQVRRWTGFVTPAESAHLALVVRDLLAPSSVADPRSRRLIAHPIRTSSTAVIGPTRESLPVQAILRRIAQAGGTQVTQGEPLSILHYAPGQQYREHLDALPNEANQRIATALIYLNTGFVGGETLFPHEGLAVRPAGGEMVLFPNSRPDGTPDPRSRHSGAPVRQGVKWAATRWIRAQPLDIWNLPKGAG